MQTITTGLPVPIIHKEENMAKNKNTSAAKPEGMEDDKPAAAPVDDFQYETVGVVTLPQLKTLDGIPVYVRIDASIKTTPKKTRTGAQATDEDGNPLAISTVQVVDMRTGEMASMVAGAALVQNLKDAYPNDGYVGRCFRIVKQAVPGKRWKGYDIREIKDPTRTK